MHGSLSTDLMRHLHTRQYIGKALVVCDHSAVMLSAARKQWLRLSRNIQRKRASTLNADEILKYTHAVTHMQHIRFTSKTPFEDPEADVYFLPADMLDTIPAQCLTVYLTVQLTQRQMDHMLDQLPSGTLVVNYTNVDLEAFGLQPKQVLEQIVHEQWQQLEQFLATYHIDVRHLSDGTTKSLEQMEEALDILLGASHKFMQIASDFQRALEVARPLRLSKEVRRQYDAAILLAHRVQALTPGAFSQSYLETYNEDDTFFLYDPAHELTTALIGDNLSATIERHIRANRPHLAAALKQYYLSSRHAIRVL